MKLGEYIRLALSEIYHNKVRTLLTLIGIIIGIAAVIVIIFVVHGAETYAIQELESIVPLDLIQVQGRWDPDSHRHLANIRNEDIKYLKEEMGKDITAIAPVMLMNQEFIYKNQTEEIEIMATTPAFKQFYELNLSEGSFFSEIDVEDSNKVIVIGYDTAEELFPNEEVIGKRVRINGVSFTVVGVTDKSYQSLLFSGGLTNDGMGFVPISVYERMYSYNSFPVFIRVASLDRLELIEERIIELLDQRHGLTNEGESKFRSYNFTMQIMEVVSIISIVLMILLTGVASFTLLVSGIGVMNIMLVIITERTKEIGLRKAIGANRRDILLQFIIESIILCLVGGVLGIFLGYFASNMLQDFAREFVNIDITVPTWSVIVSILFTSFVGLFFGIYPAAKASRLDPIKALHYE
ncbi:ABC transporter permease [Natronospora cellulosivora (SeqCode)]